MIGEHLGAAHGTDAASSDLGRSLSMGSCKALSRSHFNEFLPLPAFATRRRRRRAWSGKVWYNRRDGRAGLGADADRGRGQGDLWQGAGDREAAGDPAVPRSRAARRCPRRRQDGAGARVVHLPGRAVPAYPVYPRPAAGGRARRLGVPRPHRPVRVPAGSDHDQHPAGGRDQPRHAAHPVGVAGGDVRGPDQRRGRHYGAARPVFHARHREPGRVRRHFPAAGGAARPLLSDPAHGLPVAGGGAGDPACAAAPDPPGYRSGSGHRSGDGARPAAAGGRGHRGAGHRGTDPRSGEAHPARRPARLRRLAARLDGAVPGRPGAGRHPRQAGGRRRRGARVGARHPAEANRRQA